MTTSSVIVQQCTVIEENKGSMTTDKLKSCLDTIVIGMNEYNLKNDASTISMVLTAIHRHDMKLYDEPGIVNHQLFVIIRDYYLSILQHWRSGRKLDKSSSKVFLEISSSFASISSYITDSNATILKQLLISKPLIDELSGCLTEIATDDKYLRDHQIKCVDLIMRAIYQIFQSRIEIQNDTLLMPLLDATVKCLCSPSFINMFKTVTELEELNEAEAFLLDTCTEYFSWYGGDRHDEFCYIIRSILLKPFAQWLISQASSFRQWSEITVNAVRKLGNILLDFDVQYDVRSNNDFLQDCYHIVNCYTTVLSALSLTVNDMLDMNRAGIFLLHLYLLTRDRNLLSYIKSQQLSMTLIDLANANNEYVQFNAYRILAVLLTEQDIKTLANPGKIASVFVNFLKNVIDDPSRILRLRSILRSLKNLVQHDQIKVEFLKQTHGLPLLIRCATEPQLDPEKIQLTALEIIMTLAFNGDVGVWLRQNNTFIQHLRTLTSDSNPTYLRKAADGILWQLFSKHSKVEEEFQYDVMISYSHKDKDICHRIHKTLVANKFRVWIDLEEMHGAMMQVMADAVKHSRCILICMSETYYSSPYCQSEAQFAFEKRRVIIPLIVQSGYKADGWLAFLTSCRIYVDFTKMDFDTAYTKVVSQIRRSQFNAEDSSIRLSQAAVLTEKTMRHQVSFNTSNRFDDMNSNKNHLKYDCPPYLIDSSGSFSSVESCVENLYKRVDVLDSRLEKITRSLNWMMTAMARVKMAKDDPPLIEEANDKLSD